MKSKKWLSLVLCLALFALPGLAAAADSGYLAIRGGLGSASDTDRTAGPFTSSISFDSPYSFSAAYGRNVLDWLRLEGELGYTSADVDGVIAHSGQDANGSGSDRLFTLMINGFADYHNSSSFTPFAGAGLGPVYANHDVVFTPRADTPGSRVIESDDSTWVLGYQFMAGVAWEVRENFSLELMYRYFGTTSRSHDQEGSPYTDADLDPSQIQLIMLGLRLDL